MSATDILTEATPWVNLGVELIKIGIEYGTANAEKKVELMAKADTVYAACRDRVLGLASDLAANNAAADAVADSKPSTEEVTKP